MPWVNDWPDYDYRFLPSGELEFRGRGGRYHVVSGCSVDGWFEFQDRISEAIEICQSAPEGVSIESLYGQHQRFRYLCNRCLKLNGIKQKWVTPSMVRWLLFARKSSQGVIVAPLQQLNELPEPRYPKSSKKRAERFDKVALIAAIATHCGGNLNEAYKLATSEPARELLASMEELNWLQKTPENKHKAKLQTWREKKRAESAKKREMMMAKLKGRGDRHG